MDVWKRDVGNKKKRREMCCNKESVGGVFLNFLQCSFVWKKKITLSFSVTPALCHFSGAVDVSLRVQYLHLHCWPCTAYCRWWPMERVSLHRRGRQDQALVTADDDLILFWDIPGLFHTHIYASFLKNSVLCVAKPLFTMYSSIWVYTVVITHRAARRK